MPWFVVFVSFSGLLLFLLLHFGLNEVKTSHPGLDVYSRYVSQPGIPVEEQITYCCYWSHWKLYFSIKIQLTYLLLLPPCKKVQLLLNLLDPSNCRNDLWDYKHSWMCKPAQSPLKHVTVINPVQSQQKHITATEGQNKGITAVVSWWLILPAHPKQWRQETKLPLTMIKASVLLSLVSSVPFPQFMSQYSSQHCYWELCGGS